MSYGVWFQDVLERDGEEGKKKKFRQRWAVRHLKCDGRQTTWTGNLSLRALARIGLINSHMSHFVVFLCSLLSLAHFAKHGGSLVD